MLQGLPDIQLLSGTPNELGDDELLRYMATVSSKIAALQAVRDDSWSRRTLQVARSFCFKPVQTAA